MGVEEEEDEVSALGEPPAHVGEVVPDILHSRKEQGRFEGQWVCGAYIAWYAAASIQCPRENKSTTRLPALHRLLVPRQHAGGVDDIDVLKHLGGAHRALCVWFGGGDELVRARACVCVDVVMIIYYDNNK